MAKTKKKDAGNIKPMNDIAQRFLDKEFDVEHYKAILAKKEDLIEQLTKKIEEQASLIVDLKQTVEKGDLDKVYPLDDEEEIALLQLEKLKEASRKRQLSLEELKMYDILVKNKRLAQGRSTAINTAFEKIKNLPNNELLELANKHVKK